MIKAVIFDFDGTLADSFDTLIDIFQALARRRSKLSSADIKVLRGMTLKNILAQLHIRTWQLPYLLFKGRRLLASQIDTIQPFTGITTLMEHLARQGYGIFIVSTNHQSSIERFLRNHGIKHVKTIHGSIGLTGKTKALRALIKREHYQKNECVYVGDETRDVEAAHKAGLKCIAVTWGFNNTQALEQVKPYALAQSPAQIPGIVRRITV